MKKKIIPNFFSEFINNPQTIRKRAICKPKDKRIYYKEELKEVLQNLKDELPDTTLVIIIDGLFNFFALDVYIKLRKMKQCVFWQITSDKIQVKHDVLNLNLDHHKDLLFINNLVADLVVLPSEPKDNLNRLDRWLKYSRYILRESEK